MKKIVSVILMLIMMLSVSAAFSSCKTQKEEQPEEASQTAETDDKKADTGAEEESDEYINPEDVVKMFNPDSEEVLDSDIPMQIEAVFLDKQGHITIVPTDDLKKNELGDSESATISPFAESGVAKDMYLLRIGNGGYRTIVALMDDGTISSVNVLALIKDHIAEVMDNLGGRDTFVEVRQGQDEDGFSIVGVTEDGTEIILDPILLSEDARGEASGTGE